MKSKSVAAKSKGSAQRDTATPLARPGVRKPFMLLLSPEEKAKFNEAAQKDGLPLGGWIRMCCLHELTDLAKAGTR